MASSTRYERSTRLPSRSALTDRLDILHYRKGDVRLQKDQLQFPKKVVQVLLRDLLPGVATTSSTLAVGSMSFLLRPRSFFRESKMAHFT
jgi:hypothetical protein